jgi:hypothetical protein
MSQTRDDFDEVVDLLKASRDRCEASLIRPVGEQAALLIDTFDGLDRTCRSSLACMTAGTSLLRMVLRAGGAGLLNADPLRPVPLSVREMAGTLKTLKEAADVVARMLPETRAAPAGATGSASPPHADSSP